MRLGEHAASRRALVCAALLVAGLSGAGANSVLAAGVPALPDHRAWELVSPPEKNGADVLPDSGRTRAASDGSAVGFASLTGFGDVRGTGITVEYLSVRDAKPGTNGWATHAITSGGLRPLSLFEAAFAGLEPRYMGDWSPDASKGIFLSHTPLTAGSPFTEDVPNIYVRDDLRIPGSGHYRLVSDCPGCSGALPASPADQPAFAGASADFSHVVFESSESLTADVPPCDPGPGGDSCPFHLYEWADGVVRLAGILPAGDGGAAAANSQAGQGAFYLPGFNAAYTPNVISRDGTRIFFTVRGTSDTRAGALYMRQDNGTPGATTVHINASERTVPDPTPSDATFWAATPDGSEVFFTSAENLTDSNGSGLYRYDVNAPSGHHLKLLSGPGASVLGLVGASADGSYAYFVAEGQLEAGKPTTDRRRLFVWHDDGVTQTVHEVADVNDDAAFLVSSDWTVGQAARVSPDGRHLLFAARGTGDTVELPHSGVGDACPVSAGCREVYAYDATVNGGASSPICISCHPGNQDAPSQTDARFDFNTISMGSNSSFLNHPLSTDGRYAFFQTGDSLEADDRNHTDDVYEYDASNGEVHLLSSGAPESLGAYFMEASADGHDVFFITRDQLVGWDKDRQQDLYDARVGGGLPEPVGSAPPCTADACRGPQAAQHAFVPRGSSTFVGAGNVKSSRHANSKPRKCRRGHARRRVHGKAKCVKVKHRHAARRAAARKGR